MPDNTDAVLDVLYAFTTTHRVHLAPDAVGAVREVFDLTVGNFARQAAEQAAEQAATVHPWENDDFRAFILGQVGRIAEVLRLRGGDAPVAPEAFRDAATDVMRRTHRVCRVAAERGRLKFVTEVVPSGYQGYLCAMYLETRRLDAPPATADA